MHIPIISVATATPHHQLSQSDSLAMAHQICCVDERQSRLTSALFRKSGVQNLHTVIPYVEAYRSAPERQSAVIAIQTNGPSTHERMALYEQHALPLALQASSEAITRAAVLPDAITHVVTVSCTGFTAPGIDSGLIRELHLPPTTQRINVGYMGCHGAINGLRVAHALGNANSKSRILLCAVELCSLHYCFHWNSERMLGNALFADGAGAVVLGGEPNGSSDTSCGRWRVAATGSNLFPDTAEFMTWNIENYGFAMTISSRLPELIQQHLCEWLTAWLAENNLSVNDVQSWAVHPGGPRVLEAVEAAMEIKPERLQVSRDVLCQFGNMSSATVLFILDILLAQRASAPCVMLGFGPGLVAEAALLL